MNTMEFKSTGFTVSENNLTNDEFSSKKVTNESLSQRSTDSDDTSDSDSDQSSIIELNDDASNLIRAQIFDRHDCLVELQSDNIHDVPDNGHCLLSAFYLSMPYQNRFLPLPNMKQIKRQIQKEVTDNFAVYASFMTDDDDELQIIREMKLYINKGRFDNDCLRKIIQPLLVTHMTCEGGIQPTNATT